MRPVDDSNDPINRQRRNRTNNGSSNNIPIVASQSEATAIPEEMQNNFPVVNLQQEGVVTQQFGETIATTQETTLSCRDDQTISDIEGFELTDESTSPENILDNNISAFIDRMRTSRIRPNNIGIYSGISSILQGQPLDNLIANLPTEEQIRQNSIQNILENLIDSPDNVGTELGSTSDFSTSPILALGKNNLLIDPNLFAGQTKFFIDKFILDTPLNGDKIRYYTNSLYTLQENNQIIFLKNISQKEYIKIFKYFGRSQINQNVSQAFKFQELYIFKYGASLKTTGQEKQILLNTAFLKGGSFTGSIGGETLDSFSFQALTDENTYYDNCFSLQLPFLNNELLNSINLIGAKIVDIIPTYNFYIKGYENIANVNNNLSKENIFPNLYVLNEILKQDNQNNFYNSLITLNNNIPQFLRNIGNVLLRFSTSFRVLYKVKEQLGQYFDDFGTNYNLLATQEPQNIEFFNNKNKNIILLSDVLPNLKEINNQKFLFPMNIEISIPTDKTANITQILHSSGLIDTFIAKLFDIALVGQTAPLETIISEQVIKQNIQQADNNYVEPTVKNLYDAKRKNISYYSLDSIIQQMLDSPSIINEGQCILIGDTNRIMNNSSGNIFENNLKMTIFKSKLEDFMKNNLRTYEDIVNGKLAYNETVGFKVSKYEKDGNTPIQNYWIANDPNQEFIKLIDTQIKYNKEYEYKIFAYQFVLGNKYSQTINTDNISPSGFFTQILQNYDANIVEVELLSTNTRIVDSPPLSPEILFVPYNKVDNKIGLFLNGKTGEEILEPVSILQQDIDKLNSYNKNLQNKVIYRSDDIPTIFQIFRLESKPKSYSDFKDGFIKMVNTDIDENTLQSASAAAYIDSIESNKKYYYTFRTIDVHDNISNPSPVYEVEIINDKGTILPIIKLFEFEKPKYDVSKKVRRFIKIQPSIQHTLLDKQSINTEEIQSANDALINVKLGTSNIAVPWGKLFKLVVTSMQTGKKMEIKFKFNYKS